ncbi:hypothetical protein CAE01nite_00520 [Cellulomonas aerilata]|uniref:Uncharacterized protein n=1 Tax=Cellulomonas aerilata TaxID=515326 RepID=A0A512D7F9_9CELL|nr:hypothetical protein CAE01nite_00520 [Cellulomonas aerilata]
MTEHVTIEGHSYVVKSDHRDGTALKSQWTVPVPDEHEAFRTSVVNSWHRAGSGWGLHLDQDSVAKLGESARAYGSAADLYVAFFQLGDICHGYPSDPLRSSREIPPAHVQRDWLDRNLLRPATVRKIGRGLRCKP